MLANLKQHKTLYLCLLSVSSPMVLAERSRILVSGARKCGTWERVAPEQETDEVGEEQEHWAGHMPAPSLGSNPTTWIITFWREI